MKCPKCNNDYSHSVMPFHNKRCITTETKDIVGKEDNNGYSLEELHQMCIDSPDRKYAPSIIKRWKEDRAKEELGL